MSGLTHWSLANVWQMHGTITENHWTVTYGVWLTEGVPLYWIEATLLSVVFNKTPTRLHIHRRIELTVSTLRYIQYLLYLQLGFELLSVYPITQFHCRKCYGFLTETAIFIFQHILHWNIHKIVFFQKKKATGSHGLGRLLHGPVSSRFDKPTH